MVTGRRLVHGIDVQAVETAIRNAERHTSGEIRVGIARIYFWGDVLRAAERTFRRLHMERTRLRNGVLLFLVPGRRRFAVFGDVGIHQHVGTAFWTAITERLTDAFRGGDLTGGLERAIAEVGAQLSAHFPPEPTGGDLNELSDTVAEGQ